MEDFHVGIRRFIVGLGKKVLIADSMAPVADQVFSSHHLTPAQAWLGATAYAFQIYFDFSGYSDMAIGMGRMFGFHILENFNYPYISSSMTEFWHRWHISLSRWFRDYLYIPLGGNRKGKSRTYLNLLIVFFLCGLWHGASWCFVAWGLYHGAFLILERDGFSRILSAVPRPVRHAYALLVILIGWVLFRSETVLQSITMLRAMCGLGTAPIPDMTTSHAFTIAYLAAILGSMPTWSWTRARTDDIPRSIRFAFSTSATLAHAAILLLSIAAISASTSTPFLYYRF